MKALALSLLTSATLAARASEHEKHIFKTFDQAIAKFEFDWEVHKATTEDGYVLNMFRLLGPLPNSKMHAHKLTAEERARKIQK